ncbi:MAG: redoxin domain-containing protein [Gemmataceae bacterium]
MRSIAQCLLVLTLIGLAVLGSAEGDSQTTPQAAKKIESFTLKDASGKNVSLADFKDKKAVVVVFLGTECPINNAYAPRLAELSKTYADKGVPFLAINSNSQDTPERITKHVKEFAIPFPVLKDESNRVADQFGARRTPEVFVLDKERVIRYRGRIDDQYGAGFKRPAPTRNDLAIAVDEVLAGKEVTKASTEVAGCLISRAVQPKADGKITYAKEVSRILQKNCQECHRSGQIGPMPLVTYDDAAAWSDTIREVVADQRMPPWHADPKFGKFTNDRSLTKEDRGTLLEWIKAGCPKGDEKELPAKKEFAEGWRIGKPDVVFEMEKPYKVPAETPKGGIPYQYFGVPTNFKEDMWVQAAEARPGNRAVVHHIIVYIMKKGERRRPNEDGIGDGWLVPYAPGDMPAILAPGTAKKVPKDALLVFQMHYTPNGVEQTDRSSVGLIFAKEPPAHEMRTRSVGTQKFVIPAGASHHEVVAQKIFKEDALLYGLLPHMHLRGKDFAFNIFYPDGKSETLLSVPRYDFNWQSNYRLEKPLPMPAGTRIECTAHYDNSTANPNNPNANEDVRWGDQTWQEMMIGFVDYAYTKKEAK